MHTLAITSFKGGTAKTSTALHLGAALAKFHKKKVLLIDFDSQANLTTGLGFDPDENDSLAAVLQGEKSLKDVIRKTTTPGLELVPADTWLERVEVTGPLAADRYSHEKLRDILKDADYDFIIIDTPPSLCWLTESALIAAQHTLVCATPEFYSIKGLERLSQFVTSIGQRHALEVLGVVLSFWNPRGRATMPSWMSSNAPSPTNSSTHESAAISASPKPRSTENLSSTRLPRAAEPKTTSL